MGNSCALINLFYTINHETNSEEFAPEIEVRIPDLPAAVLVFKIVSIFPIAKLGSVQIGS